MSIVNVRGTLQPLAIPRLETARTRQFWSPGTSAAVVIDVPLIALAVKRIKEFRNFSREVKSGETVGATLFAVGDFVDAIGTTKGRGFEGVVKRHRFAGGDQTHGAKGFKRRSGAIGQRLFPGTVMRGMKMPGHMGQVTRTTQNLEIIQVREADNLLLIKGSCPGAEGDYVIIRESKKRPKGWKPAVSAAPVGKKKAVAAAAAPPKN